MGIVEDKIRDLKTRQAKVLEMGGEKAVAAQREKGKLTYAVLLAVANKWRGVRMDAFTARQVEELRKRTFIDSSEKQSAA